MKKVLLISLFGLLISACNSNTNTESGETTETTADSVQFYEYQRAFTKLTWTAYKTTAKIGVNGSFDEFNVDPGVNYGTVTALLDQLEFSIPVSTTNSENEERDGKIVASFFGSMMNTESIAGKFTSVAGNDTSGSIRIEISMNDIAYEVDGTYAADGNKVTINTSLHLGDWKAEPSVDALNKVCDDLHKGEDGVSKLWPNVDIVIETSLKPVSSAS